MIGWRSSQFLSSVGAAFRNCLQILWSQVVQSRLPGPQLLRQVEERVPPHLPIVATLPHNAVQGPERGSHVAVQALEDSDEALEELLEPFVSFAIRKPNRFSAASGSFWLGPGPL